MKLTELGNMPTRKLNNMLRTRFGQEINFDTLTVRQATRIHSALTESLKEFRSKVGNKANTHKAYMKKLLIAESIQSWIAMSHHTNKMLAEAETDAAEVILASKDFVDRLQKMVEEVSSMVNEDMPPLVDTARKEIGADRADSYNMAVTDILTNVLTVVRDARQSLDSESRRLSGDEMPVDNIGAELPGDDMGMEPDLGMDGTDLGDEFGASEPAIGGEEEFGRERRA
tara:strand:+ start:2010 stop:2693 length:684 start_codon:yes stop_codon:yes gene_type:complete